MRLQKTDIQSKLLIVVLFAGIWGALGLVRPELMPHGVSIVNLETIGLIAALWCSGKGPFAVTRNLSLALCFGVDSAALLVLDRSIPFASLSAALSLLCVGAAWARYREARQGAVGADTPSTVAKSSQKLGAAEETSVLPMMPLRDTIIVPGMTTPLVVGHRPSVCAIKRAIAGDRRIFLATQRDAANQEPKIEEISQFGCVCKILQEAQMSDGMLKVLVEGLEMAKAIQVRESGDFLVATLQILPTRTGTM